MTDDRTSISKSRTAVEAGEFWDDHDLGDYWSRTRPVELEVELEVELTDERLVVTVEGDLARRIVGIARSRGVSSEALIDSWLREKLAGSEP